MPSLYRIRVVIHSIHDSFVEIRGEPSYRIRHLYRTAFVTTIIPLSSMPSYHLRHRFHTTFVLPRFSNHLSTNQFPNFPVFPAFPTFHDFHDFPAFPTFHEFPPFHEFHKNSSIPKFFSAPAPSVATENRQGHCLTKISIIRLIRSFIFLFAETIVINLINCQ